jgi:hypothetical protein
MLFLVFFILFTSHCIFFLLGAVSIVAVENLSTLERYSSVVGMAMHFHHIAMVEVSKFVPAKLSRVRNLNNVTLSCISAHFLYCPVVLLVFPVY